jgi:hypothetical protein
MTKLLEIGPEAPTKQASRASMIVQNQSDKLKEFLQIFRI